MGKGEAVDTIPSILNKCLLVSPDERTDKRTHKPKAICSPLFQSWGHNEWLHWLPSHILTNRFSHAEVQTFI